MVKIDTPSMRMSCERDVTITEDSVKYDGCYDTGITRCVTILMIKNIHLRVRVPMYIINLKQNRRVAFLLKNDLVFLKRTPH